eukprot:scaffold271169_cov29-Tisochrysis_lutea.AAC.3
MLGSSHGKCAGAVFLNSAQRWIAGYLRDDLHGIVVGARGEHIGRRVPHHILHVLRMRVQHRRHLVGLVFCLPHPHALVSAAGGHVRSGGRPSDCLHLIVMPCRT